MAQKCDCGSRNAINREPNSKRIKPQSPISLNDNPIMFSIPRAALQPSERQLHEDKDHPITRKKPFNKTKKYPSFTARALKVFAKTVFIKIEL